ncbi:MAG: hypothetical protein ACPHVX_06115, partial [Flavobacteriaceae bacterium]
IKDGTATTKELELANVKLLKTIEIRQKNIDKGALKNIEKKKLLLNHSQCKQFILDIFFDLTF